MFFNDIMLNIKLVICFNWYKFIKFKFSHQDANLDIIKNKNHFICLQIIRIYNFIKKRRFCTSNFV